MICLQSFEESPTLSKDGLVQILLTEEQAALVSRSFDTGHEAMDFMDRNEYSEKQGHIRLSPQDISAYDCTGYHPAGGNVLSSKYNHYREGFIFSNGKLFDIPVEVDSFHATMQQVRSLLHKLALEGLEEVEESLQLPKGYFEQKFAANDQSDPFLNSSQWHMKRYHTTHNELTHEEKKEGELLLLPVHTDPSLVSVVIHDEPGIQEGGWGLEYHERKPHETAQREWKQIPQHGHRIATIMIGSAMGRINPNSHIFPPVRHRVVPYDQELPRRRRMALTYFLRPDPQSLIQPLFSVTSKEPSMNFGSWYQRVSSRYNKKTKPTKINQACKVLSQVGEAGSFRIASREEFLNKQGSQVVTSESGAKCDLIYPSGEPLSGKEQYLGGELGKGDGMIYAIPGHAKQVLLIDPNTDCIKKIGPLFHGEYKWLRSVQTSEGIVYGLPCHADSVLRIDTNTGDITTFGSESFDTEIGRLWKYHGGSISPHDGCIYCIPQSAERVLKIDPRSDTVSLVGPSFPGRHKWYGGLIGKADGAIYGIPQNATGILKIDPSSDNVVTLHGNFELGGHKWHGGANAPDGSIIGIPANANSILKIDPGPVVGITQFGDHSILRSGNHRSDDKYKFLGAVSNPRDGCVYLVPSDADRVVQVDPINLSVREIGPSLTRYEPMRNNKWQNGFLSVLDNSLYAIPLKGQTVLRVEMPNSSLDVLEKQDPSVMTIGGLFTGLNKWEGGVMAHNGTMYCMPLNHKAVLKISPQSHVHESSNL